MLGTEPQLSRVRPLLALPETYDFKVTCRQCPERRIQYVGVPSWVERTTDEHIRAVVRHYQTITLHRAKNFLKFHRQSRQVFVRFHSKARTHRQRPNRSSGLMRSRKHVAIR